MKDAHEIAIELHKKCAEELINRRIEIFDYLLDIGANPDIVLELQSIEIELTIRRYNEKLGLH